MTLSLVDAHAGIIIPVELLMERYHERPSTNMKTSRAKSLVPLGC